jgi:hypothetical protein
VGSGGWDRYCHGKKRKENERMGKEWKRDTGRWEGDAQIMVIMKGKMRWQGNGAKVVKRGDCARDNVGNGNSEE